MRTPSTSPGRGSRAHNRFGPKAAVWTSRPHVRPGVWVTKWLYLPGRGWEAIEQVAEAAEIEAASRLTLSLEDDPALVPLETLPGRDHYRFPPARCRHGAGRSDDDRAAAPSVRAAMRKAAHGKRRNSQASSIGVLATGASPADREPLVV